MNKKFCCILPNLFTEVKGGAEKQALLIAQAMSKRSWEVSYIRENTHKLGVEEKIDDIDIYAMPQRHTKMKWLNSLYLWRLMAQIRANYWYCRGTRSYLFTVWFISKFVGGQVVWACSNDSQVSKSMRKTKDKQKIIYDIFFIIDKYLFLYALRRLKIIILQNHNQKRLLEQNWNISGEVIYNSVEVPLEKQNERENNILWIGRLQAHKHPQKFVRIAEYFSNSQLRFYLIGGGIGKGNFIDEITHGEALNDNFHYLGEVGHDRVISILSKSRILVNTADYEGFPNLFLEAWSCGVPVVTLKVDPDDIIKKENLGRVSVTIEEMIKNIKVLTQDRDEWAQLSENTRNCVALNFNVNQNIDKLESLLVLACSV